MSKKLETRSASPRIDIGIGTKDRAAIAAGLSRLLADTYTLYLTTHNFHWNVTGPMFNTLHTMFMAQYTELWNAVDPIAERIRSLDHVAPGSYARSASSRRCQTRPKFPPGRWRWSACLSMDTRPWRARRAACFLWPTKPATNPPRIC